MCKKRTCLDSAYAPPLTSALALHNMDHEELKELVTPYISGSTITEITEQDGFFIVYFVNNEYYETKDMQFMLVGAGPLLINKVTKQIFETGSGQIPAYCIESYNKTGTINSQPSNIVEIHSYNDANNKNKAILLLKNQCSLNTVVAKEIVEKALNAVSSTIELESIEQAEQALKALSKSGFRAELLWQ